MKPCARRVTIAATVLGAAVVGALVVANWGTVRDHVEAWWFQLTTTTRSILPRPELQGKPFDMPSHIERGEMLQFMADYFGREVVIAPRDLVSSGSGHDISGVTGEAMLGWCRHGGWRIVEQRLPRRAYVVIHDDGAKQ
jgi:hypothetical protein